MIFSANTFEQQTLNLIPTNNYVLIRLTRTMIEKNNIDANGILQTMLKRVGIVDFNQLPNGGSYGIKEKATFIEPDCTSSIELKFYRVNNSRGDRRFSIDHIKKRARERKLNEGDLICIGFTSFLFLINLTNNVPSPSQIATILGKDPILEKMESIKPVLKEIIESGWHPNYKGSGKKDPKDVGDTFEQLLAIPTNNYSGADIDGLIEVKTKANTTVKDTLFTLRPSFEGTQIEIIEPNYKSQVSAFTRNYGYYSIKHPGKKCLYVTISSKPNPQGLSLEVQDDRVNIKSKSEVVAFWTFESLKNQLETKHPSTIWVSADTKTAPDGIVYFKYNDIIFTRTPRFEQFLLFISQGKVVYDWRGYVTPDGPYKGKNHGNAWRVSSKYKYQLFDVTEKLF